MTTQSGSTKTLSMLLMFYIDMKSQKGDAIRGGEIIREMSNQCEIEFIGINADEMNVKGRCYSVPLSRWSMPLAWNAFAFVYGLFAIIRSRPDVIYSDTPLGSFAPTLLSFITGKPLILEVHGPVGATDVALYRAKSRLHLAVARWLERTMFRRAKLVIAADGWARLVRVVHGIPAERIAILPLAVNHQLFRPLEMSEARRSLNIPQDIPLAVFVGNVGPWQGLDGLVSAAPSILAKHPQANFLIVGDGASLADLSRQARELNVEQAFRFVGTVPYEQVPTYIAAADLGLALFPGNRGKRGGVSSLKTLNYLACGRPLVISDMDEMAVLVEERGAGKSISPDNCDTLADAINSFFSNLDQATAMRERAFELGSTNPGWDDFVTKALDFVQQALNETPGSWIRVEQASR